MAQVVSDFFDLNFKPATYDIGVLTTLHSGWFL